LGAFCKEPFWSVEKALIKAGLTTRRGKEEPATSFGDNLERKAEPEA
jgi:hypothetical protein